MIRKSPTKPDYGPVLFGGLPGIPPAEVFANARKNNPPWYQALEAAYEKFATRPENVGIYADPKGKGATVEQAWLVFTLLGVEPYCVLAHPVPQNQTARITRLVRSTARQLVDALQAIQRAAGKIQASTLHYDGKTGHCITVQSYDQQRDRFVYHDPWPLKSLLCAENNIAGVDAQPEETNWSVTSAELEGVVFASFVLPHLWARLQGEQCDLMFEEWKQGEFFQYFHLKQTAERSENGMNRRMFSAGPFQDSVTLIIDYKDSGKIVQAVLLLDKQWIVNNLPLALDVGGGFIRAFAPGPDREAYVSISRALQSVRDPIAAMAMRNKNPEESQEIRCVHAFMGSIEKAAVRTDFGSLSFKNLAYNEQRIQEMEFTLL
jgi:hypothetical protein